MSSIIYKSIDKNIIHPPKWIKGNVIYEVWTGSAAYGASNDSSDMDIYAVCIPPKYDVFPNLQGYIDGFGTKYNKFTVWQQHHVEDKSARKEYDFTIYSIVNFFNLCLDNNPNMIDALFVPRRCILYSTPIGELIRDNRHKFLHKGAWHRFRGYSYAQMKKIKDRNNVSNPKRQELIKAYGYDTKFAMQLVRLLLEVEEILTVHDLNVDRNSDILKLVRNGHWTFEQLEEWFQNKEKALELTFSKSTLREEPDENEIKEILIKCLEMHYQSIKDVIKIDKSIEDVVNEMQAVIDKYKLA